MNKYMKFNFNAEKVTKEEYEEWNRITFPAFYMAFYHKTEWNAGNRAYYYYFI